MHMIEEILDERARFYGTFSSQARIAQELKQAIALAIKSNPNDFMADQVEALDMIASKIGRIVNGNPNYIDSWEDIAGYARLVSDRLREQGY